MEVVEKKDLLISDLRVLNFIFLVWFDRFGMKLSNTCAYSATGTRTQVARVRAEYPNQLDYGGHVDMAS